MAKSASLSPSPPFYTHQTDLTPTSPTVSIQSTSPSFPGLTLRLPTLDDLPTLKGFLANTANTEHDLSVSALDEAKREEICRKWTVVSQPLINLNFLLSVTDPSLSSSSSSSSSSDKCKETPIGLAGLGWIGPADKKNRRRNNSTSGRGRDHMLEPYARGKGYAYEVLRIVIDYGFRVLGLVEVRVGTTFEEYAHEDGDDPKVWMGARGEEARGSGSGWE